MIKTVTKIGNSQGIIFDAAIMDLAHLKVGDEISLTIHEGGTITLTPVRPQMDRKEVSEVIRATLKDYARTMRRLA